MEHRLGALLTEFPTFEFDLEDYLHSVKIGDQLCSALVTSRAYQFTGWETSKVEMVRVFNDELSGRVEPYSEMGRIDHFTDIPFLDKRSLARADSFDFSRFRVVGGPLWSKTTSGTSGRPLAVLYDAYAHFSQLLLAVPKILMRLKLEKVAQEPVLCFRITDSKAATNEFFVHPDQSFGVMAQWAMDPRRPETFPEGLEFIRRLRPAVISTRPELLQCLLPDLASLADDSVLASCVLVSGSALSEELRQGFQSVLRIPVYEVYASSEFGLVGSECFARKGLHIDAENIVCEVLDGWGQDSANGELVLSSLINRALPLIRYKTGDYGSIDFARCPCGDSAPRLTKLEGRAVPCFHLKNGTMLAPTAFNHLSEQFDLAQFQVTQLESGEIEVLVEPSNTYGSEGVVDKVAADVDLVLRGAASATVKLWKFDPAAKFMRYRCLVG